MQVVIEDDAVCAPIVIPTCNRYEHLKECVESLAKCTHAEKSELYISVDSPPDDSYREGWEKINSYVRQIGRGGFKRVRLFFQEKNLGALANGSFVIDKAFEEYDSVIFTGDDNIFAPAFLDYMNKMLRVYEKNSRIWIVSGFSSVRHHYKTPVYLSAECRDWGMGVWKEKWHQMASCDQIKLYEDYAKKTGKVFSLYLHNKRMFCVFVHNLINRQVDEWLYDSTITSLVYMLEGYAVYPACSLVISKGWDGSGERCAGEFISEISSIELRDDALFAFDDSLKRIPICKRFPYPYMEWTIRDSRFMKAPLSYILYRIMGRERLLQWRERKA